MIKVSQDYFNKSLAPGRNVRCRIHAGDDVYTDKDILTFEFNDVVHPDDMSFGTTCANRFQFELWSRHNIPLTTTIKPLVGFADSPDDDSGGVEMCSLGEFFITRRYRRRERYSVTCYDKMYRLDSRYNPSVNFPCSAVDVLADIGWLHDFKVGFEPEPDVIEFVPRQATCREIIGYIAGINGGFAKFDRSGVLQLKRMYRSDFALMRSQYTELSVKADLNEVRQVDFVVEDEVFSAGRGTKVSTYRQYNPYGSEEAAKRVFDLWNGFSYRGLTVKMRGLPFLESGDGILVQDDVDSAYYFALISDYSLFYDGGLTGRLVSKSKNPIDDSNEPLTQQRMMESLSENLRVRYTNYINEKDIFIDGPQQGLATIHFNLETRTFAVFNSQFTVTATEDCIITLEYFLNNEKVSLTPETTLKKDEIQTICLYNCFRVFRPGRNTLALTAKIDCGQVMISAGELIASVSGQYMLGDGGPQIPQINITQRIERQEIFVPQIIPVSLTGNLIQPQPQIPIVLEEDGISESIAPVSLNNQALTLRGFTEELLMDSMFIEAEAVSGNRIMLVFSNKIRAVNTDGLLISFGIAPLEILSFEIVGNEMFVTIRESLNQFNELVIKYDRQYGNIISEPTRNAVQSFNYILNLEN
jgi:hypothetical protein